MKLRSYSAPALDTQWTKVSMQIGILQNSIIKLLVVLMKRN